MKKLLKLSSLSLFSLLFILSCKSEVDTAVIAPEIKAGTATITGKVKSPKERIDDGSYVNIFVSHPISGEVVNYKADIDQSGKFSIDVDVETDVSLIALFTSLKPHNSLYVKIRGGGVTYLDISYGQNMEIEDVQTQPRMSKNDMIIGPRVINEMLGINDPAPEPQAVLYDKSPETYINFVKSSSLEKIKILNRDSSLSKESKEILARDFNMWRYSLGVFDYERSMRGNYRVMANDSINVPDIHKIDRSYFSFLKDFDLNNPQYLICPSFSDFQVAMLKNKTLAIPEIAELDISSWLASVKGILSDVVGFKDGQYYDILAANAYGSQLTKQMRPLTEKQKKNITDYWEDGEIAKILLSKSQQIEKK